MATLGKPLISQKPTAKVAVTKTNVAPPAKKLLTSTVLSAKTVTVSSNATKTVRKEISKTTSVSSNLKQVNERTTKLDDKPKPLMKSAIIKPSTKPITVKRVADSTQKANGPVRVNRPLSKEPSKPIKKPTTSIDVKPKSTIVTNPVGTTKTISSAVNKAKISALSVKPSAITISKLTNSKPKVIPKVTKPSVVVSTTATKSKNLKSTCIVTSATKPKLLSTKETSKPNLKPAASANLVIKKPITSSRSETKPKSVVTQKPTSRPIAGAKTSSTAVVRPRLTKGMVSTKNVTKASPVVEIRDADSTSSFNACNSTDSSPCKGDQVLNFDENRAYEVAEQLYEVMKMQEDVSEDVISSVKALEPEFKCDEKEDTGAVDPLLAYENEINHGEFHAVLAKEEANNSSEVTNAMEYAETVVPDHSNVSTSGNEKIENMECDIAELEDDVNVSDSIDETSESFVFELPTSEHLCKCDAENIENDQVLENTEIENAEFTHGSGDVADVYCDQEITENFIGTEENLNTFEDEDENRDDPEIAYEEETNENYDEQEDVFESENDGYFDEDTGETVDEEISNGEGNQSFEMSTSGQILANDVSEDVDECEIQYVGGDREIVDDTAEVERESYQSDSYFCSDSLVDSTVNEREDNDVNDPQVYCHEENDQMDDNATEDREKLSCYSLIEGSTNDEEHNNFYESTDQHVETEYQTEDSENCEETNREKQFYFNNDFAEENTIVEREDINADESQIQYVETDDLINLGEVEDNEELSRIRSLCFGNVLPLTNIIESKYTNFDETQEYSAENENGIQSSNHIATDKQNFEMKISACEQHPKAVTDAGFVAECESIPELQSDDTVEMQENYFCENFPNDDTENVPGSENSDDQCNSEGFVVIKPDENEPSIAASSSHEEVNEPDDDTINGSNDGLSYAEMAKTPPRTPLDNCSVELDDQVNYRAEILNDMTFDKMSLADNDINSFFVPFASKESHFENYPESVTNECEDFVDINAPIPVSEIEHCPNEEDKSKNFADDDGYKTIRRRRNKRNKKNKGQRRSSVADHYEAEPLVEIQENVYDDNSHYRRKNSRRMKCSPKKHFRGTADSFVDSSYFYTNPVWKSYYAED